MVDGIFQSTAVGENFHFLLVLNQKFSLIQVQTPSNAPSKKACLSSAYCSKTLEPNITRTSMTVTPLIPCPLSPLSVANRVVVAVNASGSDNMNDVGVQISIICRSSREGDPPSRTGLGALFIGSSSQAQSRRLHLRGQGR